MSETNYGHLHNIVLKFFFVLLIAHTCDKNRVTETKTYKNMKIKTKLMQFYNLNLK